MSSCKKFIQQMKNGWQTLKMQEAIQARKHGDYELAKKLAECSVIKGDEDLEEICALAHSPKGVEFITKWHYPDLELFRKFKPYRPERYGLYIDEPFGENEVPKDLFLIGDSPASIEINDNKLHHITLAHGAYAYINVFGYAVVRIVCDDKSSYEIGMKDDTAVIME